MASCHTPSMADRHRWFWQHAMRPMAGRRLTIPDMDATTGIAPGLGARVRWVRELVMMEGAGQAAAARLLRCDQGTYNKIEKDGRGLSLALALRMCQAWGVTLDYIYRARLTSEVNRDLALRLAAAHPELVGVPAEAVPRAKEVAPAA